MPLLLVLILAGGLIAVTLSKRQDAREAVAAAEAEAEPVPSPFADLPEDVPPWERDSKRRSSQAPDLSGNPYAEDEEVADHVVDAIAAEALFQDAVAALEESDQTTFHAKGGKARRLFEQALDGTAAYAEALVAEHGDVDADVRAIVRAREFWEERRLFLHKMVR